MRVTGFAELTLQTRDPAALARFYSRAFGLIELSRDTDRVWPSWTPRRERLAVALDGA